MLSCQRATEQISQAIDRPLSLSQRLELKVHLMMCKRCSRCEEQLQQIHRLCQKRSETDEPD